jgi:hypothetical protein
MNDNYLWDCSGEPDAEIQQLEELLGTLRYEPRPLQIPAQFTIRRRPSYFQPLAIAAGLLLFAVAISLWINFKGRPQIVAVKSSAETEQAVIRQPASAPDRNSQQAAISGAPKPVFKPTRHPVPQRAVLTASRARRNLPRPPVLTNEELAQKDQVLLALRMVSTKLNVAQRKLQGGPRADGPNAIRNQHKIG